MGYGRRGLGEEHQRRARNQSFRFRLIVAFHFALFYMKFSYMISSLQVLEILIILTNLFLTMQDTTLVLVRYLLMREQPGSPEQTQKEE